MDEKNHPHVDQYIETMYGNLKNSPGHIDTIFDASLSGLDEVVLWSTFHEIAYKEVFKRSSGDLSVFADYTEAVAMQTAIAVQWPIAYYLDKLEHAGIVHKFETVKEVTYAVKEAYIPVLNMILTEVEISEGS